MKLEESRRLHAFYQEWEEEDMFIKEKEREAVSKEVGKDLVSLTRLLKKHEVDATVVTLGLNKYYVTLYKQRTAGSCTNTQNLQHFCWAVV